MIVDFDLRNKWDGIFSDFEVVEKMNDCQDIIYLRIVAPWGVTDRDFLQKRTVAHNYKGFEYSCHFVTADHDKKPKRKKHIRANTIISGYLFNKCKDDPNNTEVHIVACTDIKVYCNYIKK